VRDNVQVDEGDTVILPYREERDALDVIRTSAAVLSSITGLIVSIVFIFR
jgi:hypothetical protein